MVSEQKTESAPAASAAPAAAGAAPAAEEPSEPSELMKAYMWSPPLLVAWGCGYITDWSMFCCMTLMGLPYFTNVAVAWLGGRGAFRRLWDKVNPTPPDEPAGKATTPADPNSKTQAKKQARAAAAAEAQAPPEPTFAMALKVPLSVWLPPIMLVATTSAPDQNPVVFCTTAGTVYAVIVCGQYLRNKFFGVPKF